MDEHRATRHLNGMIFPDLVSKTKDVWWELWYTMIRPWKVVVLLQGSDLTALRLERDKIESCLFYVSLLQLWI